MKPTCGEFVFLQNRKKKCITSLARKANAKWKFQNRAAKRLRIMQKRKEALAACESESEETESDMFDE